MGEKQITVLIVEDSQVSTEYLKFLFDSDSELEVIGTVTDGEAALRFMEHHKPDIITMDVNMPKMNGFDATRKIMELYPTPIVIVTASWNPHAVDTSFRALDAGALSVMEKPRGFNKHMPNQSTDELVKTVKLMSKVKVVRRWSNSRIRELKSIQVKERNLTPGIDNVNIIAIGASTGGPSVLHTILSNLPKQFPVPVLIVQHIAPGFLNGMIKWLEPFSNCPIHIPTHGEKLMPGTVYLAPDSLQMGVEPAGKITLTNDHSENGVRPSVSYLFRSVMKVYGDKVVSILLTGMGKDGALELKLLHEKGAVTIAQDKESSAVHGMPGEAIRLGAATYILSPVGIANMLSKVTT